MDQKPRRRLGATYAIVTGCAIFLGVMVSLDIEVVRADFIGTNPYRTYQNSLAIMAIEAPLAGIIVLFFGGALSIAVSALSAKLAAHLIGHVPWWILPIISLLCLASLVAQAHWASIHVVPPDGDENVRSIAEMIASARRQLFAIYIAYLFTLSIAWWLTRPGGTGRSI